MSRAFHKIARHTPRPTCSPEQVEANIETHDWVEIDLESLYVEADPRWAPVVACTKCEILRWSKGGARTNESLWACGETPPSIGFDEYLDQVDAANPRTGL